MVVDAIHKVSDLKIIFPRAHTEQIDIANGFNTAKTDPIRQKRIGFYGNCNASWRTMFYSNQSQISRIKIHKSNFNCKSDWALVVKCSRSVVR